MMRTSEPAHEHLPCRALAVPAPFRYGERRWASFKQSPVEAERGDGACFNREPCTVVCEAIVAFAARRAAAGQRTHQWLSAAHLAGPTAQKRSAVDRAAGSAH